MLKLGNLQIAMHSKYLKLGNADAQQYCISICIYTLNFTVNKLNVIPCEQIDKLTVMVI